MSDAEARFTRLYEESYPRVLAYTMRRASPDTAREAADETFLVAWRRWAELPAEAALPWLLVVARNILCDQYRRGQRQDALGAELARATFKMVAPGLDSAVVERVTVLTALAELSIKDREVLFLTVWDGLNNRDAAIVDGCSTATFTVRLYRARRRLAAALEQLDAEQPRNVTPHLVPPRSRRPAAPSSSHHHAQRSVNTCKEEQR